LIDTALNSRDFQRVTMAIYSLGEMHDSTAAVALGRKLTDPKNWLVRASAGEAILKMNASSARSYLRQALRDSNELVRGRAARALAIVANHEDLGYLTPLLNDRSQIVRYQLQMGLKQRGADSIASFLIEQLQKPNGYASGLLAPLAGDLKDTARRIELQTALLRHRSPKVRATGVRLATIWNDPAAIHRAAAIRSGEKSSIVLYELDLLPTNDARQPTTETGPSPRRRRNR
jgi:HEAT repeat protein